jgi:hypothetical protein
MQSTRQIVFEKQNTNKVLKAQNVKNNKTQNIQYILLHSISFEIN